MPMSPQNFRVKTMSECAEALLIRQLRMELDFYKELSLSALQQLECIADTLAAGNPISISIGRRPAVCAVRKRGKA